MAGIAVRWMVATALLQVAGSAVESDGSVLQVVENSGVDQFVGQLFPEPVNGKLFNFTDPTCGSYFSINSTAAIVTRVDVDRENVLEEVGSDELQCVVRYQSTGETSVHHVSVTIQVLDINDETPSFYDLEHPVHEENVVETLSAGSPILVLQPDDKDKDLNGTVFFNITAGNEDGVFQLDFPPLVSGSPSSPPLTKYLYLVKELNYEMQQVYNLTISISDMGQPEPLTSTQYIVILVTDLDDERPVLTSMFMFEVSEDHPVGVSLPVGNITTVYQDGFVFFRFFDSDNSMPPDTHEFFSVESHKGHIFLTRELDFEMSEYRQFKFQVEVQSPASSLITYATVEVKVMDVNDELPYFKQEEMDWSIVEGEENLTLILRVYDNDESMEFKRIQNLSFTVEPETPTVYFETELLNVVDSLFVARVFLRQSIDGEQYTNFTLFLTANDSASPPNTGSITIHVSVLDLNDNAPTFSASAGYFSRVAEDSPVGKEVGRVHATDPDKSENGTVVYSIESTDNNTSGWFDIDSNGVITVLSPMNYGSLATGKAILMITAQDSPTNSTPQVSNTTFEIELSPGVTFAPRSFQEHNGYDILGPASTSIYLEFRTTETNGLLLYQIGPNNRTFSLGIEDGHVNYRFGSGGQKQHFRLTSEGRVVSDDKWYSVLVSRDGENLSLQVWATDREDQRVTDILQPSTLARCPQQPTEEGPILYVGGQDLLSLPENATFLPGLVGAIKNLIVDSLQVDLSCPSSQENTALGLIHVEGGCTEACGEGSVCVSYATEPYCSCLGGFPHTACQGEMGGYAPITLTGEETATLTLGYSFFFDLFLHGSFSPIGRRRKRQTTEEGGEREVVHVSFRPAEVQKGTLLYSRTPTSVHALRIDVANEGTQVVILYTVFDSTSGKESIRLSLNLNSESFPSLLYNATIVTTDTHVTLSVNGQGYSDSKTAGWGGSPPLLFAQAPQTNVYIGGVEDPSDSLPNFTGCVVSLSINDLPFPLSGLASADGSQFTTSGNIVGKCDLCTFMQCPENSSCISDTYGITHECPCLEGYVLSPTNSCVLAEISQIPDQGDLESGSVEQFPFYYIIGVSLGGVLFLGFLGIILILVLRYRHRKSQLKRTYHINGSPELGNGHIQVAKPNSYTNVEPRPDGSFRCSTSRPNTPGPAADGESVAKQNDADEQTSSNSCRKSTTSAETGFHTGSERDERSIPRMEDSGNEKETDYSPFDSDSEQSMSCIEESTLPAIRAQRGSSENVMGVPASPFRVPLTPREKKAIEPLRPDSRLILSTSECEDETDTEFVFPPKRLLSKTSVSRPSNSPTWYKASTPSDTEREARRAQGTCAYYHPIYRPPFNKSKSMPMPPEYLPPPTISSHKSASPKHFPHFYCSSSPEHAHLASSPLARLSFKYSQKGVASPVSEPKRDTIPTPPVYPTKSQPMRLHSLESYSPVVDSPHPYTYSSGIGGSEMGPPVEAQFQDLKSMKSRINPIAYWEGQSRMRAAVDQVDPYQLLSEPYVQFEDVSTQTSVLESSMLTTDEMYGPEHQEFSNQGGREGTADILDLSLTHLPNEDLDTLVTDSTVVVPPIKHFPSADCSEEYTNTASLGTLVASSSGNSTPKFVNGYSEPSSQQHFDV